jgi:hypothetical protein
MTKLEKLVENWKGAAERADHRGAYADESRYEAEQQARRDALMERAAELEQALQAAPAAETPAPAGKWRKLADDERRVKAKRPGLKELVKRISEANWVQLMNDGKCEIVTEDKHSNVYSLLCFSTIAELKDYLATLPEKE